MSDKPSDLGWRLMSEMDHSLMALAQALRASEPKRLQNALDELDGCCSAIREAQQAKTADAMWKAWEKYTNFRTNIFSSIREIERLDLTARLGSPVWKIVDGADWMTPTLRVWLEAIFSERKGA